MFTLFAVHPPLSQPLSFLPLLPSLSQFREATAAITSLLSYSDKSVWAVNSMYAPVQVKVTLTIFDSSDNTLFTLSGQANLPPDSSLPIPGLSVPPLSTLKTNYSFVFVSIATVPSSDLPPTLPKTYWLPFKDDVLDWYRLPLPSPAPRHIVAAVIC